MLLLVLLMLLMLLLVLLLMLLLMLLVLLLLVLVWVVRPLTLQHPLLPLHLPLTPTHGRSAVVFDFNSLACDITTCIAY